MNNSVFVFFSIFFLVVSASAKRETKNNLNTSFDVDETFKIFDQDDDGFLSAYEFNLFCHSSPLCPSESNLDEIVFNLADANDDGKISYKELVWMVKYTELVVQKFQMNDKDADGFVTGSDISCSWCISDHDYDGDGKLSFTEYMVLDLIMNMVADSLSEWSFKEALSMISLGIEEGSM